MAGWVKLAGRSFVGAALVGAAQLGAAQALAVLVWSTVPTTDVWRRQLTWLVFIFAAAVLGGVVTGRRSVRTIRRAIANRRADAAAARHAGLVVHQRGLIAAQRRAVAAARGKTVDTARGVAAGAARVCATVFAALGAATSFALVWLPARNAYDAADLRVLSVAAGLGVAVGAVLSLLCLTAAPVAANVGVSLAGVWLFGLASVGMTIATGEPSITPRLGVLDAPKMIGPDEWWLGPNLMVAVAAILGFAVAATARWIGAHRLSIALSGIAGPTVVAAAYLLVGPAGDLLSSYVAALLAATVGLLTSAATAAANQGTAEQPTTGRTPAALTAGPAAAPRRPLAIESGPAAQYSAVHHPAAGHHPAAAHAGTPQASPAYADVAYAGSSSRASATGRRTRGKATPPLRAGEPAYASAEPVYVAPQRSAPVSSARTSPPAPPHHSMPPTAPVPPASAWPMAPPTQHAAPARPVAPPMTPAGRPAPPSAPPPPPPPPPVAAQPAAPAAPPAAPPARPTASPATKSAPPAAKPAATRPATPPVVPPPAPPVAVPPVAVPTVAPAQRRPEPEPSRRARKAAKGKSVTAQPAPVQPAQVQPAPVQPAASGKSAAAQPAATGKSARGRSAAGKVAATETAAAATADKATDKPAGRGRRGRANRGTPQPRTSRPVEVVAVEASRPSHDATAPTPKGRLARRRAAKLAAERAEAEAQLRRLMEREAITMNKREREHVDWVKHLVSLPDDPTLTTRQK